MSFIQQGWRMNCEMAIDFTMSNGHYEDILSLHSLGSSANQYKQAISQVYRQVSPF